MIVTCKTIISIIRIRDVHKKKKGIDVSYLDEPNIAAKLVDFKDDHIAVMTFYIPVIHCSSCIWLLEHLYKLNPAVVTSQVDFMKKQATITFKHNELSLRGLVELLIHIGYEPKITLQDVVKEGKKSKSKRVGCQDCCSWFLFW